MSQSGPESDHEVGNAVKQRVRGEQEDRTMRVIPGHRMATIPTTRLEMPRTMSHAESAMRGSLLALVAGLAVGDGQRRTTIWCIADVREGGLAQPIAQLLEIKTRRRHRLAERLEFGVSLTAAGQTPDRPVARIRGACHAKRVADAVPEHLISTGPPVAGAEIATVVGADDFVATNALVPDPVEECSGGPALMRTEL